VEPKNIKETAFRNLLLYRLTALLIFYDRKERGWQEKFAGSEFSPLSRHNRGGDFVEAIRPLVFGFRIGWVLAEEAGLPSRIGISGLRLRPGTL
jgi:hypothetical protein